MMFSKKPKMKYCIMAIIFALCFCLSACQPTPETKSVQQKNQIYIQNEEQQSLEEMLQAPTNWNEVISPNEKLEIDFGAVISVPEVQNVILCEVYPQEITQKRVTEMIEKLFGNAQIFNQKPSDVITQEEITKEIYAIRNLLNVIKETDTQRYDDEVKEWNQIISSKLSTLGNYPETFELVPSDGKFNTVKKFSDKGIPDALNPNMNRISIQADIGNDFPALMEITQSESLKDAEIWFSNGENQYVSGVRLPLEQVKHPIGLKLSLNEAEQIATDFVKELGFDNYYMQDAYYGVLGEPPYSPYTTPLKERNPYFYDLYFTQKSDNVPLSFTSPYIQIGYDEQMSEGWGSELVNVYVNDEGVFVITWRYPTSIGSQKMDSVVLLKFDEIKSVIKKSLEFYYTAPNSDKEIVKRKLDINKIEFSYAKCLNPNNMSEYILTPCWNVYGNIQTYYSNLIQDSNNDDNNSYVESKPMGTLLTINAINGSLINTDIGY